MKTAIRILIPAAVLVGFLTLLFAAYSYYYTDNFATIDPTKWAGSGTGNGPGLTSGTLISTVAVPGGSREYEVKSTLAIPSSGYSATFRQYLRADPNGGSSHYRVEFYTFTNYSGVCTGTVQVIKRDSGGVETQLGSALTGCSNPVTLRSLVTESAYVVVFVNNVMALYLPDTGPWIQSYDRRPGVGVSGGASGNAMTQAELGNRDTVAPSAPTNITCTAMSPTRIDGQWYAAADGANGIGVWRYHVYRNGVFWTYAYATSFSDQALSPGTQYTYTIYAQDFHLNLSSGANCTATTPGGGQNPAVATPPLRTGVRSNGTYWGAAPEQLDLLSGNLNWTMPLLKAQGRGGWSVGFALSYNSQLWRKDGSTTTKLGKDVGYGFGWRLMAGSIAPFWSDQQTLSHYVFTDSTGAEYKLDINTNGVWTSRDGTYAAYDGAAQKLMFPDGSFWMMQCVSAGAEADAGTRYPTLMQDSNGNQSKINYKVGAGVGWANSSARIETLEDVRGPIAAFYYDGSQHLTSISELLPTGGGTTSTIRPGRRCGRRSNRCSTARPRFCGGCGARRRPVSGRTPSPITRPGR